MRPQTRPRRVWLTLFTLSALGVLVGLGVWQVQRLAWKERLLADLERARTAAPVDAAAAVSGWRGGSEDDFVRVRGRCAPEPPTAPAFLYGLSRGEIGWRVVSPCRLAPSGPVVFVDRGRLAGASTTEPPSSPPPLPPPAAFVGVLRGAGGETASLTPAFANRDRIIWARTENGMHTLRGLFGAPDAPSLLISLERETPPLPGVIPEATPPEISNNHLGYAVTWFGLAAALAGVYAAVLLNDRRRARGPAAAS